MNITEVRVRVITKGDTRLKAVASITIDGCFVIHDIKIVEGSKGYFLQMPNRKNLDGKFTDIVHPLNNETREMLKDLILAEYEKAKAEVATETE